MRGLSTLCGEVGYLLPDSGYLGLGDLEPTALLSNFMPQFLSFPSLSLLLVLKN